MNLLTYEEAVEVLHRAVPTAALRDSKAIAPSECVGRALAEPIYAVEPNPRFDNSAVDGYAIACEEDSVKGRVLQVAGESRAGNSKTPELKPGSAVRVFTGAPVPVGTFGVAMQENVAVEDGAITLTSAANRGQHIRNAGADFAVGDQLLSPGTTLGPGHVAVLTSQDVQSVRVFDKVSVAILATGDELVDSQSELPSTGLRDSNTPMLRALLERDGHFISSTNRVLDSFDETVEAIKGAVGHSDCVLISGGASVGEYDFVGRAAEQLGTILYHGVKVRPGKPILVAQIDNSIIFGLPGNPASAFVGYHIFVRDTLRRMGGHTKSASRWALAEYEAHEPYDRDDFVRCRLRFSEVGLVAEAVSVQGSFGLRSLAEADAFVRVPAGASGPGEYPTLFL